MVVNFLLDHRTVVHTGIDIKSNNRHISALIQLHINIKRLALVIAYVIFRIVIKLQFQYRSLCFVHRYVCKLDREY